MRLERYSKRRCSGSGLKCEERRDDDVREAKDPMISPVVVHTVHARKSHELRSVSLFLKHILNFLRATRVDILSAVGWPLRNFTYRSAH